MKALLFSSPLTYAHITIKKYGDISNMRIDKTRDYVVDALNFAKNPQSIAVVGASRTKGKVGNKVVEELLAWHFNGKIFPVNPNADEILGLKCYHSLEDIGEHVNLVFVAIPASLVFDAVKDAAKIHADLVAVASSGFKEIGKENLQNEITEFCRSNKLPLIGPNLLGMGCPYSNFNCGFIPYLPIKGHIAMISQSGANLLSALGTSQMDHLGMSFFIGLGNKADVDFPEFIEFANRDPNTNCISLYMEGLDSPEAFVESARKADKPIVVIKTGGSQIGNKAALAHTASDNPHDDDFYDRVIKEAGCIRATTWQEFLDISLTMAECKRMQGNNVVMITNGGGAGLLACDHFERLGVPLKEIKDISPLLVDDLRKHMPSFGSVLNPVDIAGTATAESYKGCFEEALKNLNVHAVLGAICPTAVTDVPAVAKAAIEVHEKYPDKPFVMICQGGQECRDAINLLRDHGIPAFATPEQAVNGLAALEKWSIKQI